MVLLLHGCGQSPAALAASTRMNAEADLHGFVVGYPEQTASHNMGGCWNWHLPEHQQRGAGEPAALAALTGAVVERWEIDPRRVFAAGMSAGGAMAAVLGATYPDVYAAIGIHSGIGYGAARDHDSAFDAMWQGSPDPVAGGRRAFEAMGPHARAVPTIVFHGTEDYTVAAVNGERAVQQWLTTNSLSALDGHTDAFAEPASVIAGRVSEGYEYGRYRWNLSGDVALQEYWHVLGLGHAWSGGDGDGWGDARGPSASRAMVAFFDEHPMPEA